MGIHVVDPSENKSLEQSGSSSRTTSLQGSLVHRKRHFKSFKVNLAICEKLYITFLNGQNDTFSGGQSDKNLFVLLDTHDSIREKGITNSFVARLTNKGVEISSLTNKGVLYQKWSSLNAQRRDCISSSYDIISMPPNKKAKSSIFIIKR